MFDIFYIFPLLNASLSAINPHAIAPPLASLVTSVKALDSLESRKYRKYAVTLVILYRIRNKYPALTHAFFPDPSILSLVKMVKITKDRCTKGNV